MYRTADYSEKSRCALFTCPLGIVGCWVAVSKCENAASPTALSLRSFLPAWSSLLGIGRDTIGVCCG